MLFMAFLLVGCSDNSVSEESVGRSEAIPEYIASNVQPEFTLESFGAQKGDIVEIKVTFDNEGDVRTFSTNGPARKVGLYAYEITRFVSINAIDQEQAVLVTVTINGVEYASFNTEDYLVAPAVYNDKFLWAMEAVVINPGAEINGFGEVNRHGAGKMQEVGCWNSKCCSSWVWGIPLVTDGIEFLEGEENCTGTCYTGYDRCGLA